MPRCFTSGDSPISWLILQEVKKCLTKENSCEKFHVPLHNSCSMKNIFGDIWSNHSLSLASNHMTFNVNLQSHDSDRQEAVQKQRNDGHILTEMWWAWCSSWEM
jgi:hypothetical protein